MKRLIAAILMAAMASGAWAGGWSATYSLASGAVGVTNGQVNSSWAPVAVLFKMATAGTGTTTVSRVSQGYEYALSDCRFTNVSSLVWVPEAAYSFGYGDVLMIRSSETGGVVQVIGKAD